MDVVDTPHCLVGRCAKVFSGLGPAGMDPLLAEQGTTRAGPPGEQKLPNRFATRGQRQTSTNQLESAVSGRSITSRNVLKYTGWRRHPVSEASPQPARGRPTGSLGCFYSRGVHRAPADGREASN